MISKFKKIILIVLTLALILSASALMLIGGNFAYADQKYSASTELFLPKTGLEYKTLNSPIDAYSDDGVTAIVENSQSYHVLTVITEDGYYDTVANSNQGNLLGVKKFNDDYLLYANAGDLFSLSLSDFSSREVQFDNKKGISSFDVSDNFLVTSLNTEMALYKFNNSFSVELVVSKTVKDKSPVAINANGDVFIVCKNNADGEFYLSKFSVNDSLISTPKKLAKVSPTHMVANDEYVYYLENGSVFRLPVDGENNQPLELMVIEDGDYDLGKLVSPSGISFKGDNLLITDTHLNAVQEFKVDSESLIFTGFAVAKDKTAYNRISRTVLEVEKYGDTVAILDNNKLSVINASDDFNAYDRDNFTDYFSADLGGKMPNAFALGNGTALLSFVDDVNTNFGSLKLLDLSNGTLFDTDGFSSTTIQDLTYQSGNYYALVAKGSSYKIYKATEVKGALNFTETQVPANHNSDTFAVDVFGNVFVSDKLNSKIDKYSLNDATIHTEYSLPKGIKKIATDIGGGLFALTDTSTLYLDNDGSFKEIALTPTGINDGAIAKSFAMDFINKDVYLVYDNEEFVYKTSELNNLAISSLSVPNTYITTAKNADLSSFKAFTPSQNANVYDIEKTETGFTFNGLISERETYALITEIVEVDAFGREIKLLALAGQKQVVLINALECENVNVETFDAPEKAYVTTAVHSYFLPISTPDDGYALTDTNKIRLAKQTLINPQKTFAFLDITYYFATTTIDGVTYAGYIPTNFTVEVLSEEFEWDSFTVRSINKTNVYVEKELITSLTVLNDGEKIRVLEQDGGVSKIAYKSGDDDWVIGYIKSSAIKNPANIAIRNILIILAVAACVCGTTTYFFLRRKV